jgi:hypothetical protein
VPRSPDPNLHALWRERVRLQAQSGLTIAQFCARESLPANSFYAWRRRLHRIEVGDRRPALPVPAALVSVRVRFTERAAHEPLPIEAELPCRDVLQEDAHYIHPPRARWPGNRPCPCHVP